MSSLDIKRMSVLLLALISLGVSAAIVVSSFLWWTNFSGGALTSDVDTEARGFPVHYYSVISTYLLPRNASSVPLTVVQDFDIQTLIVDVIVIFIICLGVLTLWRWRALSRGGVRNRRRL